MIPFCRTVAEAHRVLDTMATHGLKKGENGLRVYAMCEIPSNVILAEQFLDVLDGFSIGSNDLTQVSYIGDASGGGSGRIGKLRSFSCTAMAGRTTGQIYCIRALNPSNKNRYRWSVGEEEKQIGAGERRMCCFQWMGGAEEEKVR